MDVLARYTSLSIREQKDNGSCPWEPPFTQGATQPLFGNTTFYQFNVYFSGACAIFATLVIFSLQFMHATHLSRPAEQIKIIRICQIIPSYSLISWFSVLFPQLQYYLHPWLDFIQSICLATFFLLLCEFIAPSEGQRALFFAAIDIPSSRDKKTKQKITYDTTDKKLQWYRRHWIAIFQYPLVALGVALVTDITQSLGKYCDPSFKPGFAHLWTVIFINVSVTTAIGAILMMYKAIKVHLAHHYPLAKLGAFKLIVLFAFLQGILFAILHGANVLKPTPVLTYADLKVGIPTMLTCIEMVPIALFFHFAYSYRPYCMDPARQPIPSEESAIPAPPPVTSYQGGFLGYRAILAALSPREVLEGSLFAFKMANEYKAHKTTMSRSGHNSEGGYGEAMEPLRSSGGAGRREETHPNNLLWVRSELALGRDPDYLADLEY